MEQQKANNSAVIEEAPRLVVRLSGGLGNQLFQLAHGVALSQELNRPLMLDLSDLHQHFKNRSFQLDQFVLHSSISWGTLTKLETDQMLKEQHFEYADVMPRDQEQGTYVRGFWQSERYFEQHEKLLRELLQFKQPLTTDYQTFNDQLATEKTVAVHVRRTDYISDPAAKRVHPTCDFDYYKEALQLLESKVGAIQAFVFSDDPVWCRQQFKNQPRVTIVRDFLPADDRQEFQLMTHCKHHIIANSTYSWWAAWLGKSAEQKVIAPQRWFRDSTTNTTDLIPKHWIRI